MKSLRVPGDKSVAHRALLLAALATGSSRVRNVPASLDVRATRTALQQLGVTIHDDGDAVVVRGVGGSFRTPGRPIDCGNSGTTMRLLAGVLATRAVSAVLDGDASLRARPMRRVSDPLRRFGALIQTESGGTAPLRVRGNPHATGVEVTLDVPSAQVKSAVLFAALGARGLTRVSGRIDTRDHTERLFAAVALDCRREGNSITIVGPAIPNTLDFEVPGDISSAAFLLAAAAASPGTRARIEGVGLNPTRTAFLDVLRRFGAEITVELDDDNVEPRGSVNVTGAALQGIEIEPREVPGLIDELPLVGILGMFARGTTLVHGAEELRHKESDRIDRFVTAARAMGTNAEALPDGFAVHGGKQLHGAEIVTGGDHRIAMAFLVAGRIAGVEVRLDDPNCTAVSFPDFAESLAEIAQ